VLEEADNTRASVQEVRRESLDLSRAPDGGSVAFDTAFTVEGVVSHLNHVHLRLNRYHARYRMEPVDGLWKITGADQLSAERVTAEEKPDPAAGT
jgi:hypothetical protein